MKTKTSNRLITILAAVLLLSLIGCNFDARDRKLNAMKRPVVVVSNGGGYSQVSVLFRGADGRLTVLECACFIQLQKGDTIK